MFCLLNKHDLYNLAVDHILPRMLNVVVAPYRAFDSCEAAGCIINTMPKKTNDFVRGKPQTSSRLMSHHREGALDEESRLGPPSESCLASGVDASFCAFHDHRLRPTCPDRLRAWLFRLRRARGARGVENSAGVMPATVKTATLAVSGMTSVLDYQAIEKRLGPLAGVLRATASAAFNSVTLEYDEAFTNLRTLEGEIAACGFQCSGEIVPEHVREPRPEHGGSLKGSAARRCRATWGTRWATAPAWTCRPWSATFATACGSASLQRADPSLFPHGNEFISLNPPFGMNLNSFLFVVASAAFIYPVWPFVLRSELAAQI